MIPARSCPVAFLLCALALVVSGPPALASERVMLIIEERVDDRPAANPVAEIHLSERLIAAGQQVVDAVETERARRAISVDKLLRGVIDAEITALNCDVLLVGRTATIQEEIPYGVTAMSAVSTEWTVRAVAVDTGRVLVSTAGTAQGAGTQAQAAANAARKKAADAMYEAVAKTLDAKGGAPAGAVSLTVRDLQELADVETLKSRLATLDGVRSVSVRFVSADETRIDVAVTHDTWAFAALLKKVGLEVAELSRGAVTARWTPWGAAGKSLAVAAFTNETGIDQHDWIEPTLPEVFATELANSRYLRVAPRPAPPAAPLSPTDPPAELARAVKASGADLLAIGALERLGPQLRLSVTVLGPGGEAITAAQVFSTEPGLVDATRDLVWALDARLFERLFAKGALGAYQPAFGGKRAAPAPADARAPAATALRVRDVAFSDVFPALLSAYATRPLGKLVLANDGTRTATDVRVRVAVPGLTAAPATLVVADLAPGQEREVPLTLVLDRGRVQQISENTPAQAEIAISWTHAPGDQSSDSFTVPILVFDKNALDWSEPAAIAAFTTHKDPSLDALARAAERLARPALDAVPEPLRGAFTLYEALGAAGLRYQADARNPFGVTRLDAVAFPAETLARKAGDCDDLSVLMAALFESQGTATAFVLTPGHVLVAFDSGVATRDAHKLGLPPSAHFDRDGRAWIPLEPTRVGAPLAEAISAGAAEVQRHRDDPKRFQLVDTATAWRTFPPFPAAFARVDLALDALPARLSESTRALAALGADHDLAAVPDPAASDDPAALNRAAVRLIERGQWRRAAPYLERARTLAPDRPDLAYNLANLRVVEGRRAEAQATYESLREVPALAEPSLHALGVIAYLDGRADDARTLLKRSNLPDSKQALTRLGLASPPKPPARPRSTRKPAAPPPDPFLGIRAGVERVPLDELLIWLP